MNSDPVIKATLEGIATAKKKYECWSGGYYLQGAEYIATFCIADAVQKLDKVSYVTVEKNAHTAITDAGGKLVGGGRTNIQFGARFDIAVWNSTQVRGLIEVKTNVWGFSYVQRDIEKLSQAISKVKLLRWGLVAYFASMQDGSKKDARGRLNDRIQTISDRAIDYAAKEGYSIKRHPSSIRDDDGWAWTAEVLEVRRN